MRIVATLVLIVVSASSLIGCDPHTADGTRRSVAGTAYPGLWLEKRDATELRTTAKMESYCPELKAKPGKYISNVRLIEPSGNVIAYYPKEKGNLIGVLKPNGTLVSGSDMSEYLYSRKLKVTVNDQILKIISEESGGDGIEYVRTTQSELAQYYAALANCKN